MIILTKNSVAVEQCYAQLLIKCQNIYIFFYKYLITYYFCGRIWIENRVNFIFQEVIILKISTRGRYSLRMMVDLAQHYNEGYIALKDISKRQNISKKYLEQIIPFLNRSKLLITSRGHMGGYQLSKHPSEITVKDIFLSAEGSLAPVSCMDNIPNQCENYKNCLTLPVYEGLYEVIVNYLQGITLQNIINNQSSSCEYFI